MAPEHYLLTPHERVTVVRDEPSVLEAHLLLEPDPHRPPSHLHPAQDERFVVHEGTLRVRTPGGDRIVGPGEEIAIPRGTPHTMAADGDRPVRATWETRPAGGTRELWAALGGATADYGPRGVPKPVLARILRRHRATFRLALPRPLDRLAVVVLSLLPAPGPPVSPGPAAGRGARSGGSCR